MKRRIISMLLILSMLVIYVPTDVFAADTELNVANTFLNGDGTEDNPYVLNSVEDLALIRNNMEANYMLSCNIDMSSVNWEPIGDEDSPFKGTFDGNNKTISGLRIESSSLTYAGLFGYCDSDTEIKSVNLTDVSISLNITRDDFYASIFVGAIAAQANNITNCSVSGNITVVNNTPEGWPVVGGVVGCGRNLNCCKNYASISVVSDSDVECGGIVGMPGAVFGEVTSCNNYGNIKAVVNESFAYCGGICGEYGSISNCQNYGNIYGETMKFNGFSSFAGNCNVGGIVGATSAEVYSSINYGTVKGYAKKGGSSYAGGIAGWNGYYSSGIIQNCVNAGAVITSTEQEKSKTGVYYDIDGNAGRIAASSCKTEDCYSLDSTKCNGIIPTENIGSNKINGENATVEDLEKRIGANYFKDHCYKLYSHCSSWEDAKAYCENVGGHLATITSKEENDFLYEYITSQGIESAYFGFSDSAQEGEWEWVTGEPVEYTNWNSGEPNSESSTEDYGMFYYKYTAGTWNDGNFGQGTVNDGSPITFICEWDSPQQGKGAVRYFSYWDSENQIAYFDTDPEENPLNFGCQVTADTDISFLDNVDELVGTNVLVKTQSGADGMIGPNTLLSVTPVETMTGTLVATDNGVATFEDYSYPYSADLSIYIRYYIDSFVEFYLLGGMVIGIREVNKPTESEILEKLYGDEQVLVVRPYALDKTAADWFRETLPGVTASASSGEFAQIDNGFSISTEAAANSRITLSKGGYRDYIIPVGVTDRLDTNVIEFGRYSLDVYMQKDRKDNRPYISTVFCRNTDKSSNKYEEIKNTEVEIEENKAYEFVVTAVGFGDQPITYYIAQSAEKVISSTTGQFTTAELYNMFDCYTDVYVYAIAEDGTTTEPEKVKLLKQMELSSAAETLLDSSTLSLFGEDGVALTLPESLPVVGGSKFKMGAFDAPIGVNITGSKVKISVGLDLFGASTDDEEDESIFDCYKKQFQSLTKDFEDSTKDAQKLRKKFLDEFVNDQKLSYSQSKLGVEAEVLGYIEGELIDGAIIVTEMLISVGGEVKYNYTKQLSVYGVPVYLGFGVELPVKGEATGGKAIADPALPFIMDIKIKAEPAVKLSGGLGVDDLVAAGIYGKGTAPFSVEALERHLKLALKGTFGLEATFFVFEADVKLWEGETNIIDTYFGNTTAASNLMSAANVALENSISFSVSGREYSNNTSEWLGIYPAANTYGMEDCALQLRPLQTEVFPQSQAQIVAFGDKLIMVWVEDDTTRDAYNRMRLMFSIYDPETDTWSEGQAVYDDGCNDAYPSLASNGTDVYIAWQKICTTLSAEDCVDTSTLLENSEIYIGRYDEATNTFVDVEQITNNDVYDYAPVISANGFVVSVYYASCEDNTLLGTGNNTLFEFYTIAESSPIAPAPEFGFGTGAKTIKSGLNYISSLNAGNTSVSYSMDADGDYSSSSDMQVYSVDENGATIFEVLSDNAVTCVKYGVLCEEEMQFVSDGYNIYYDVDGEIKSVFATDQTITELVGIVTIDGIDTIFWTEFSGSETSLYSTSYREGVWTDPVEVAVYSGQLYDIDIVSSNGIVTGVCNVKEYAEDTDGSLNASLCAFTIDTFTDLEIMGVLPIEEAKVVPGDNISLDVILQNNGTNPIDGITFTITDNWGNTETEEADINIISGDSVVYELTYTIPEEYAKSTIEITALISNQIDIDESNNATTVLLGNCDLRIGENKVIENGGKYLINAIVENLSSIQTDGVTLTVIADKETNAPVYTHEIGTLERETYALVSVSIDSSMVSFDNSGVGKVYLKVSSNSTDNLNADNQVCVLLTIPRDTECGHPIIEEKITAPTCTAQGYTTHTCAACGFSYTDEMVAASGHDYDNGAVITKATCTDKGEKIYSCSCGDTKIEEIPAAGHKWDSEYTIDKYASETTDGLKSIHCANCDETKDAQVIPATGVSHTHSYTKKVTKPTCTKTGYTTYTCSCGDSYKTDYVAATGHSFDSGKVTEKATCTEKGIKTFTCTACGGTKIETISATGHTEVVDKAVAATCTKTGLTEGKHCSVCNTVIKKQETVAKLAHKWNEGKVTKSPTAEKVGEKTFTCTVCKTTKKEGLPALGVCDGKDDCALHKFTDVSSTHWAHPGMDFAVNNGLMNGTGDGTTFEPNTNMSRAMLVTVLWRYSGSPEAPDCNFKDVEKDDWFYNAVAWAASEGVVNGVGDGTSFDPNGNVTREMMATILYRYAKMTGTDVSASASISSYPDAEKVASWSSEAVKWAVAEGIISGAVKDDKTVLAPQDSANRAVVATIMMRFIQNVVEQ